jgi:hypothetical protein
MGGWLPHEMIRCFGETTAPLRAANKPRGILAGQMLPVFTDHELCRSCRLIVPYVGLELGNPAVTFVDPDGSMMTMRDGAWIVWKAK